jgi:hypothetical protein
MFLGGVRTLVAVESDGGRTPEAVKLDGGRTAECPLKLKLSVSLAVETDLVSSCSSILLASSSVMTVKAKMAGGGSLGGQASSTKQEKTWWPGNTAKDSNLAGRTEGDGDLELLLVKDKDNLVAKVGRVSAPVVMDLLAVVLG